MLRYRTPPVLSRKRFYYNKIGSTFILESITAGRKLITPPKLTIFEIPPSILLKVDHMGKCSVAIAAFSASDKKWILDLLSDADLPVEDLNDEKLKNFLIAKDTDRSVLGVVGIEMLGENGLLRSLTVHPSFRGNGLGHLLTRTIESFARQNGVRTLYLLTMTAAEFFEKLGYEVTRRDKVPEPIRETEEFQNVCPVSAVCLLKVLGVK